MLKNKKKYLAYLLSFITPIVIWIVVCIFHGIYPFGNNSIMTGDITYQFIDYLAYFKTIFFSNNDLVYTFSKTIGGDMAGFAAYYLSSPFNFLLLFFDNRYLPLGLLIIIILKCAIMSLSFMIMLENIYGYRIDNILFSVSYSLMGFVVVYYQLYAYFDNFILFPIIIIGFHRMLKNNRSRLVYIVSLFLAISINFYVGWMICIFLTLYFIYNQVIGDFDKYEIIENTKCFIINSLISGLLSAFIVIPALLSLRGEKNSFNLGFYKTMSLIDFFSRMYTNSFKGNISSCMPNIYCGVLMIVLIFLYFTNDNIRIKDRIASAVFLIFIILNFYVNTFNVVWHGLNIPIGFPYRYSFIFTFLIIIFSYRGIIDFSYNKIGIRLLSICGIMLAYSGVIIIRRNEVLNKRDIIINLIIVMIISVVMYLHFLEILDYRAFIIILLIIQFSDLAENFYNEIYYFELENINKYQEYIDEVGPLIENIKENDKGFYRIEKYFRRSHNDSMQFNYNGLTHYSSCEKKDVISYMGKLGFRDNGNWSFYDSGSTAFVDTLFGIKYVLSQYDTNGRGYERVNKEKDLKYYTYKNSDALSIGFIGSDDASNIIEETDNVFEFQNRIASGITGEKTDIFVPIPIKEINEVNVNKIENGETTTYERINPEEEAYVEYIISVEKDKRKIIEAFFSAPGLQNASIGIEDDVYNYFDKYSWSVLCLGIMNKEKDISIRVILDDDKAEITGGYFYYEDLDKLHNFMLKVNESPAQLNKISSSHLYGTVKAKEDGRLILSFPYEEEWEVKIDNNIVETEAAANILLSSQIKKGDHIVEITYKPAGKLLGNVISLFGLILLLVLYLNEKYNILYIRKNVKKTLKNKEKTN